MTHHDLAILCQQSYEWDDPDAEEIEDIGGIGTRAFVKGHRGTGPALVVFRGTNDGPGWVTDLEASKVPYPGPVTGNVHAGFWSAWCGVRKRILRAIGPTKCVTITGHSLGGALATLCALELHPGQVEQIVTFGSPRVGDWYIQREYQARDLHQRTTRYANYLDPIPWVPPWLMSYRHVCQCEWFNGQDWEEWTPMSWIHQTLKQLWTHHKALWTYHSIESYVAALATEWT